MRRPGFGLLIVAALGCMVAHAGASAADVHHTSSADASVCEAAAIRAARETGVPLRLLTVLAPVESGLADRAGRVHAWPWTVNANGYGSYHFRSRQAAARHLATLITAGIDNVDVGCMQLNWRWQGRAFVSPNAILSPIANVRYAALLIREYHVRTGSWSEAVGLYHTRNPQLADGYRCRVARALAPNAEVRDCGLRAAQHDRAR